MIKSGKPAGNKTFILPQNYKADLEIGRCKTQ